MKLNWSAIGETFFGSKWRTFGTLIGLVVLLGLIAWAGSSISNWNFNRGVKKDKAAIAVQVQEISNTQAEISNLNAKKAQQVANVAADTQALVDASNASEQARAATNQALANMNAAISANRSVDVSGIDLQRKLEDLDK
jgi:hypothetical protein